MRGSILLQFVTRFLVPAQIAYSLFLLWRGHNEPGGGFSGGLVVVAAIGLYAIAYSPDNVRRILPVDPVSIAGIGIVFAIVAGFMGLVAGDAFLTGLWLEIDLAFIHLDVGTPLLFDVGVYLLVIGAGATILFALIE
jgi:multicomponent Na+:H+ antiporter subunit B